MTPSFASSMRAPPPRRPWCGGWKRRLARRPPTTIEAVEGRGDPTTADGRDLARAALRHVPERERTGAGIRGGQPAVRDAATGPRRGILICVEAFADDPACGRLAEFDPPPAMALENRSHGDCWEDGDRKFLVENEGRPCCRAQVRFGACGRQTVSAGQIADHQTLP